jgi:two-component system, OmpR family, sensor kinase
MGRLFWKFFFFLMLAQVTTIAGVSFAIWLRHSNLSLAAFAEPNLPPTGPADGRETPPPRPERRGPGGPARPAPLVFPLEPVVGGLLASLAVAALVAWYVAKPIRNLRRAFDAAAQGNLDARVGNALGRRRDELADLGRDFDRTAARLKLLMDGQRRLLHDISHELRSPLARLQAAVGLARQNPGNVDASMDRIEREAVRMDKLVDELLTLSRVEAGMGSERSESVRLTELVHDVVEDAAFEARARSISVIYDTNAVLPDPVAIEGNREMLHRALENVVRNAGRHSPPGGTVRITGRVDAVARAVELTIADEGPGVAAGDLASIFDPFYRGSEAARTPGHGLGLAIARRVVEAHGGTITASNRPTGGLAVTLRLPT